MSFNKDDFYKKDDKFYFKDKEIAIIFYRTLYDQT